MFRSNETTIGPQIPKAPERLLRPRLETQPSNPEVSRMVGVHEDVGLRVLRNITDQKRARYTDPAAYDKALDNNEGGLKTLTQIDYLRSLPEGKNTNKNNEPMPFQLDNTLTVTRKDATGTPRSVLITEVRGRNGNDFTCTEVDSNGNPQQDVQIPRDEVLRAQMLASEPELQKLLSDPNINPQDREVVETYIKALNKDTTQLEAAISDPDTTKRTEVQDRLMEVASRNGMLTHKDGVSLINRISPDWSLPQGASLEAINAHQRDQAERQRLFSLLGENEILDGETLVKLMGENLPNKKDQLVRDREVCRQNVENAKTKQEKSKYQKELGEMDDLINGLGLFEDQIKPNSSGQTEMANWIDSLQEGNLDMQTAELGLQALTIADANKFLKSFYPDIPDGITNDRVRQQENEQRIKMLKKNGKISLAVMLALLAAGGMAAGMLKDDGH